MARFEAVTSKLNNMFKVANEAKKDSIVSQLKKWLKLNVNTEDKAKKEAIQCFLAEINAI